MTGLPLAAGRVMAHGKRTVTRALWVIDLAEEPRFRRYHYVLDQARWDARAVARRLPLDWPPPTGSVVIGIDDIIELRWR